MLGYVKENLYRHLNHLTPTVSDIHVNMAEARAVAVVLATFEQISVEARKAEPYREGVLARMRRGGGSAQRT